MTTPARAVVEAIIGLVGVHCGCGDTRRGCAEMVIDMGAAEKIIDAALAEWERATWRAASGVIKQWPLNPNMRPDILKLARALARRGEA